MKLEQPFRFNYVGTSYLWHIFTPGRPDSLARSYTLCGREHVSIACSVLVANEWAVCKTCLAKYRKIVEKERKQ
jgi:hypothetical protein